jgi:hypothetical protein
MEWVLELVLIVLLAATLFHALRLERALDVLKRERNTLEQLVASFDSSTRQAEQGVERLRTAADGAGRQVARQVDVATALKDDLQFLTERGEKLADQLDALVRAARPLAPDASRAPPAEPAPDYANLLAALAAAEAPEEPRLRSKAERDLAKALRMVR